MIGFFLEDNKIRFEMKHAKLKISARLLALALDGHRKPKRNLRCGSLNIHRFNAS